MDWSVSLFKTIWGYGYVTDRAKAATNVSHRRGVHPPPTPAAGAGAAKIVINTPARRAPAMRKNVA
jgi:hypothetical protein